MASHGNAFPIKPGSASGQHFLVVEARYHGDIADALLEGATSVLHDAGATWEVVSVPGTFELPAAIAMASELKGPRYDGFVALGCVIRGETSRHEIVATESARALMDLSVADGIALGNGIIIADTEEQAWARAQKTELNRGGDAAVTALAMVALKKMLED